MQHCTYGDHLNEATHYYDTVRGDRRYLCQSHADGYYYPQYLTQITPDPWRPRYAYLVSALTGNGASEMTADVWPFSETHTVEWLKILGCTDPYLIDDAAWEPYRAHLAESAGLTIECTRVTSLPLASA